MLPVVRLGSLPHWASVGMVRRASAALGGRLAASFSSRREIQRSRRGRDVAAQLLHREGRLLEVRVDQFGNIFAVEGGVAGDGLVENAAERVEIGAVIDGQALELFGRHVMDRAHERIQVVDRLRLRRVEILGEAEVENLDLEERGGRRARDHEVAGLEIAMDEAEGMRRDDGLEALLRKAEKILELERAADKHILERFALDEFHDDVGALCVDAVIEDGDDIGVLEAGRGHGLAPGLLDEAAVVLRRPASGRA